MASIDLSSRIKTETAFDNQTITSDTTTNGNIIDMQGFFGLTFVSLAATLTLGDFTPLIEHGDDPALSDAAAVEDDFLIGTEAQAAYTGGLGDNTTRRIGYVGKKRYIRLSYVTTNSADGTLGAIAIKSPARREPTAVDA
jgi:hypothetical protein